MSVIIKKRKLFTDHNYKLSSLKEYKIKKPLSMDNP